MQAYCFDSSALVECWEERYPIEVFPAFWRRFEQLALQHRAYSAFLVKNELDRKSSALHKWLVGCPDFYLHPTPEVVQTSEEIINRFTGFADLSTGRSTTDAWVIGTAVAIGCPVVSHENFSEKKQRPKIPNVCAELNVRHLSITQFIREVGWVFS